MAFQSTRSSRRLKNNPPEDKQQVPFFSKASDTVQAKEDNAFFQPKLTIGQPCDQYEKQADAVADAVVSKAQTSSPVHQKSIHSIQKESLATPLEDEKKGTAEKRNEDEKLVQEKPELQRREVGQEQSHIGEEEEMVHTHTDSANPRKASSQMTQKIQHKSGKGRPLAPKVRAEMEAGFGVNFSEVNIHTDSEAVQMNQELGAQAFTHGKDVFFNAGKYNTESSAGKRLLAHELTHVLQQASMIHKMIQRSCYDEYEICISSCQRSIPDEDKRGRAICYAECAEELGRCRRENPQEEFRRIPEPDGIPWWVYGLGILGAGALSLADGPFPFGEMAAASLLVSLGIIESEDSQVTN